MVDSAGPSLIPIAVRRTSMNFNSPMASPSADRHRRRTSAMSLQSQMSIDDQSSSYTPTSARRRHRTSTFTTDPPQSPPVSLSRRSSIIASPVANGHGRSDVSISDDLEGTSDSGGLDPVRAPTRSSLNKQRDKGSKATSESRRRSGTPSMSNGDGREQALGLSRIPRASVTHAVQMHGASPRLGTSPGDTSEILSADDFSRSPTLVLAELSPDPTGSGKLAQFGQVKPRRSMGAAGKSSQMIEELQDELAHTKQHLERVKTEVRNCRREIGTLTRRSEDLRETRDRMRGEAETLNNVIARKERMIAEILARARAAEASLAQTTTERKDLETRVKKSETDASASVAEANAQRLKAESESEALRDLVKSLKESWAREVESYRSEVARVREETRAENEQLVNKEAAILKLVKQHRADRENVVSLVEELNTQNAATADLYGQKVQLLHEELERSSRETAEARAVATQLAQELARIRRLAKMKVSDELSAIACETGEESEEPSIHTSEVNGLDHVSVAAALAGTLSASDEPARSSTTETTDTTHKPHEPKGESRPEQPHANGAAAEQLAISTS